MSLLDYLFKDWHVIKNAPRVFVIAIGLVGALIWFVTDRLYSEQLDTKDSTIQLLQTRVDDYQEKLAGATPEEAAQKIEYLTSEVERLGQINNPMLHIHEQEFKEQENSLWVLKTVIEVASRFAPNGLLLSFDASEITDTEIEVTALNAGLMMSGVYDKSPGHISYYIQQPFGGYEIILHLSARSEVTFSWAFDDVPGGSVVTR